MELDYWYLEGPNEVKVTVFGTGFLNAWIDVNNDGDWDEGYEHLIQHEMLSTGMHTFTLTPNYHPPIYYYMPPLPDFVSAPWPAWVPPGQHPMAKWKITKYP